MIKFIYTLKIHITQKYQLLLKKKENAVLKHLNGSKVFIEYSNDMQHLYKNIKEYNVNRKHRKLFVFDDIIADMLSNKKIK